MKIGMDRMGRSSCLRGSILPTTFLLCMLAALPALWLFATLQDHQRTNLRRRDISRAYFAAEAGVAQVLNWGNFPAEYDTDAPSGLFYRNPTTGAFPNLQAALVSGNVNIPAGKLGHMSSKYGNAISSVDQLLLIPSAGGDPVPNLFKVQARGITPMGVQRRVLAYVLANPLGTTEVKLPAGLISMASAGQGGNGTVHWGESWSKSDFEMLGKSQCDHLDNTSGSHDPWAKIRTEKKIIFGNTWKVGVNKDVFDPANNAANYDPGRAQTAAGLPAASGDFEGAFEQNIPPGQLEWPDFLSQYDVFKTQAISHGRYYSTDAGGNIYRGGIEDAAHRVEFDSEFGDANRDTSPYDIVFIDTVNNLPPAADSSNLATIQNSGTGQGMKGVFWIGANLVQTGAGNPAALNNAEKPDLSTQSIPKVYLDGVLYTAGWMNLGGNPIVYGSVVAERGYVSGGTPEVYYNHRLASGLEIPKGNVGSVFKVVLQKNF